MARVFNNWEEEENTESEEEEDSDFENVEKVGVVRATRARVRKQAEEEKADDLASAQADCEPVPLSDVIDLPD